MLIKNKLIICERIYYFLSFQTQCFRTKKSERIHKLRIVRTNFMEMYKRKPTKPRNISCSNWQLPCVRWMWPTGRAMLTCRTIYPTESGSCWTPAWAGRRSSTPSVTLLSLTSSSLSSKILEIRDPPGPLPAHLMFQDTTEDPVLHVQHCVPLHDDVYPHGARILYASRLRLTNWSNFSFGINF